MSKKEIAVQSKDGLKYKFIFEVVKEQTLLITAIEEKGNLSFPKTYKGIFEIKELSNFEKTKLAFKKIKPILDEIISCSKSNKLSFIIKNSHIVFNYFLSEKFPISLNIPAVNNIKESINSISSKLSSFCFIHIKYRRLINKLKINFPKNKNVVKILQRQNKELKKQKDCSNLLKEGQSEINKKLSNIQTLIETNLNNIINLNKSIQTKPKSKFKFIQNIQHKNWISSVCTLRNGKLVSGGGDGIVIYNKHNYQSHIIIKDFSGVNSICGLRNGNLASGCGDKNIKIYQINKNDYKPIQTIKGHTDSVYKVIELEDGRLSSCSFYEIKIWDENYQPVKTLKRNTSYIKSIIEINDYIISSSDDDVRIWNKSTYECAKTIKDICCWSSNGISKLKENTLILGGYNKLFILDILSFKYQSFKTDRLGDISSICLLKEGIVLIGNWEGEIVCYDSSSNQIIFTQQIHTKGVSCIIKTEENQIFSSSHDGNIRLYG